jgi:enoyl-CoA hydratase
LKLETLSVGSPEHFTVESGNGARILRLCGGDVTNRMTQARVLALTAGIQEMARDPKPLIITGNEHFFSAGADLAEIVALTGPVAYRFGLMGQTLMDEVDRFPAPVCAAVRGYCMGGGLDLALACDFRIAAPHAVFGHRGAALGLMTGWGGTQRLSRLIGKARALEIFVAAEKVNAKRALEIGLVQQVADDPVSAALDFVGTIAKVDL